MFKEYNMALMPIRDVEQQLQDARAALAIAQASLMDLEDEYLSTIEALAAVNQLQQQVNSLEHQLRQL